MATPRRGEAGRGRGIRGRPDARAVRGTLGTGRDVPRAPDDAADGVQRSRGSPGREGLAGSHPRGGGPGDRPGAGRLCGRQRGGAARGQALGNRARVHPSSRPFPDHQPARVAGRRSAPPLSRRSQPREVLGPGTGRLDDPDARLSGRRGDGLGRHRRAGRAVSAPLGAAPLRHPRDDQRRGVRGGSAGERGGGTPTPHRKRRLPELRGGPERLARTRQAGRLRGPLRRSPRGPRGRDPGGDDGGGRRDGVSAARSLRGR